MNVRDPRPLTGEPLPLDLLNTHWIADGELQDLLKNVEGVEIWLDSAVFDAALRPVAVTRAHQRALQLCRDALDAVLRVPGDPEACTRLNAILEHGHRVLRLDSGGPGSTLVVDSEEWAIPWLAAESYLDLITSAPGRIRQCQHSQCVLWYLDTSRSGTRRWCSMAVCGNRTKARRHHQAIADAL